MAWTERLRFEPDQTTREVMDLVAAEFSSHFGEPEAFAWPVTRQANSFLDSLAGRTES